MQMGGDVSLHLHELFKALDGVCVAPGSGHANGGRSYVEFPESVNPQGARRMGGPVFVALGLGFGREREREGDKRPSPP